MRSVRSSISLLLVGFLNLGRCPAGDLIVGLGPGIGMIRDPRPMPERAQHELGDGRLAA